MNEYYLKIKIKIIYFIFINQFLQLIRLKNIYLFIILNFKIQKIL